MTNNIMSGLYPDLLTDEQVNEFHTNGILVIKSFYDIKNEIEPIQRSIYSIIGILIKKYKLSFEQAIFSTENFDSGYTELIANDRKIGGEIYDAIKQIPAFIRLVSNLKHESIISQLRQTSLTGIAAGGYGIRIDNPNEEKYRAGWHQDYPAQFRSLDGIVFWSPLVEITEKLGPVQFCLRSHKDGLVPVYTKDAKNPEKSGAYSLTLKDEEITIGKYHITAPLSEPGDLILIDFLTLHASGYNNGSRSRWSMQMRYFNFNEITGQQISWSGSFAAGKSINEVHPELLAD